VTTNVHVCMCVHIHALILTLQPRLAGAGLSEQSWAGSSEPRGPKQRLFEGEQKRMMHAWGPPARGRRQEEWAAAGEEEEEEEEEGGESREMPTGKREPESLVPAHLRYVKRARRHRYTSPASSAEETY